MRWKVRLVLPVVLSGSAKSRVKSEKVKRQIIISDNVCRASDRIRTVTACAALLKDYYQIERNVRGEKQRPVMVCRSAAEIDRIVSLKNY